MTLNAISPVDFCDYDDNANTFTYSAEMVDGSFVSGVPWLTFASGSREFSFSSPAAGKYYSTMIGVNGSKKASSTFEIIVPNNAPVLSTPVPDTSKVVG
jgi:hypothetical protein